MGLWLRGVLAAVAGGLVAGLAAAQPAGPPVAEAVVGCAADASAPSRLPGSWSVRRRLVHLSVCEWARFGYPVVEIRRSDAAAERRLPPALGLSGELRELPPPRSGAYEGVRPVLDVQTRAGAAEDSPPVSRAIEAYWAATDPAYVERMRAVRATVEGRYGGLDEENRTELYPGWWRAWSAAYVSWTMRQAGVAWFRGSEWHSLYLAWSTTGRPERLVRIEDYRPVAGDLICFGRTGALGEDGMPTAASFVERVRAIRGQDDAFAAHCDVIVRVNRASVVAIGGNVRNAVTATVTPMVRGRLMRSQARPWSAALRMDGPGDPCARIEAVPVGPWSGEAVAGARRRALRGVSC